MKYTSTSGKAVYNLPLLLPGLALSYNGLNAANAPVTPSSMGSGWSLGSVYSYLSFPTVHGRQLVQLNNGNTQDQWVNSSVEYGEEGAGDSYFHMFYVAKSGNQGTKLTFDAVNPYIFTDLTGGQTFYNSDGTISKQKDRNGNTTSYMFDGSARLSQAADDQGRVTHFGYVGSPDGIQPTSISWMDSTHQVTLQYNAQGLLWHVIDPCGNIWTFNYTTVNSVNVLQSVTDPSSNIPVAYTYYPSGVNIGLVNTETQYGERQLTYTYTNAPDGSGTIGIADQDLSGLSTPATRNSTNTYNTNRVLTKLVDPLGNIWQYQYSASNPALVTQKIDPNSNVTLYSYDFNGNLLNTTDTYLNVTSNVYTNPPIIYSQLSQGHYAIQSSPLANLVVKMIQPTIAVNGVSTNYITQLTYDAQGNLIQSQDPLGNTTFYRLNSQGWVTSVQDPNGTVKTMTYTTNNATNNGGNLQSMSIPTGPNGSTAQTFVFEFDKYDNQVSTTDALGNTQRTLWDASARQVKAIDPLGNVSSWNYTGLQLSSTLSPSNQGSAPNSRANVFLYDSANRVKEVDSQVASGGSQQMRVQYAYNGFAKLNTLTRKQSSSTSPSIYAYGYDVLDRVTQWKDPLLNATNTLYAPFCMENTTTTARGIQKVTSKDSLCRTVQIATQTEERSFVYDNMSRMVSDTNGGRFGWSLGGNTVGAKFNSGVFANTKSYLYDGASRVAQLTFPDGKALSYGFDKLGNVTLMVDVFGRSTAYRYSNDSKLYQVTYTSSAGQAEQFTYTYKAGQLQQIQYPPSTTVTANYSWDRGGRLTALQYLKGTANLETFGYRYDNSGNRTQMVDTAASTNTTWLYGYDWLDRLVNVSQNGTQSAAYSYDFNDNRKTLVHPGNSYAYSYDLNDQIQNTNNNGSLFESFAFDLDGNMTTRTLASNSQVTQYNWSDFNNLGQFTVGGTLQEQDFYDANGVRRLKSDASNNKTGFYNSKMMNAGEQRPTSGSVSFIQGRQLMGLDEGGSVHFFVTDALSSVRQVIDSNGSTQATFATDEFGVPTASSGSAELLAQTYVGAQGVRNETGQPTGVANHGLYLMNQRWFEPALGRFLNRDIIGYSGGLNLFSYAGANPLSKIDPSGLATVVSQTFPNFYNQRNVLLTLQCDCASDEVASIENFHLISSPEARTRLFQGDSTVDYLKEEGKPVVIGYISAECGCTKNGCKRIIPPTFIGAVLPTPVTPIDPANPGNPGGPPGPTNSTGPFG
jgi:RHS repeat-associated protein